MSQESVLSPASVPRISYAPKHEDILLDRVFGDHVGTFMAVGARSPIVNSLTYFFYRRGWRGVNLEPVPRNHAQLQEARPGDLNLALAAWDSNGAIPFFDVATGDGPATFSGERAEDFRTRGLPIVDRQARVRSIRSLVEELQIDPPDFLAIDVGQSTEPVIRGIALEHWRPRIIVVGSSDSGPSLVALAAWEPILLEHGYLFATFNGVNRFYLREDLRDERARLERPIDLRDQFRLHEVVAPERRPCEPEQEGIRWRTDEAQPVVGLDRHRSPAEQVGDRGRLGGEAPGRESIATRRHSRPSLRIDPREVVAIGYRWARRLISRRKL